MTTEVKKRAINRLQSMYALRAQMDAMVQETREAQQAGKPVAWCMMDPFASPILNVMGIDSVYPENFGTLCAASGVAPVYLERAEADGFPNYLCGYMRNCIGYAARMMTDLGGEIPPEAPRGGLPKPTLLVASGMGCDTRFKAFQALAHYLGVPQWTLEVPYAEGKENLMEGVYERNINFAVKEVKEFIAFLERLLGKKMDWDKLGEDVDNTMEMQGMFYQVTDVVRQGARPGPMHSRDLWSTMTASFYRSANPQQARDLYRKMYDEVKYRVDNKISGINYEERYRLSFDGLPPWHSLGFFDQLAERGWNFVIETSYHPPDPIDLNWVSDPVEKLVRYRHQGLAHRIDREFEPDEAAKVKEEIRQRGFSAKLAAKKCIDFQLDGVFLHPILTCRSVSSGILLRPSEFMEVANVPSMVIEGDIVDLTVFNPDDAMRKAEAFEETMDYYKMVRKEKGLAW